MNQKKILSNVILLILLSVSFIGCDEESNSARSGELSTPSFLFVQNSESGTLEAIEGQDEKLLLTLNNLSPDTVYFTDIPERTAGQQPTPEIINNFLSDLSTPPRAALQIRNEDGSVDVVALSLLSAEFDPNDQSVKYEATISSDNLEFYFNPNNNQPISGEPVLDSGGLVPMSFGSSSLFIDNTTAVTPPNSSCTHIPDKDSDICLMPKSMADCGNDSVNKARCGGDDNAPKCCYLYISQFFCCIIPPY